MRDWFASIKSVKNNPLIALKMVVLVQRRLIVATSFVTHKEIEEEPKETNNNQRKSKGSAVERKTLANRVDHVGMKLFVAQKFVPKEGVSHKKRIAFQDTIVPELKKVLTKREMID